MKKAIKFVKIVFSKVSKINHTRGAFNQECESIHKIWMNKVTEVSNSL